MSDGVYRYDTITMRLVTREDIEDVQSILDHATYFNHTVVRYDPVGMAQRCFTMEPPTVEGSRVFKRFFIIEDSSIAPGPLATLDLFVGFPNYQVASIAMFVIHEKYQRKGLGARLLTEAIPGFLSEYHPAVQWISVSLTENNVPGLRCLLKCKYERTNRWEKLDIKGRPIIALNYRKKFK